MIRLYLIGILMCMGMAVMAQYALKTDLLSSADLPEKEVSHIYLDQSGILWMLGQSSNDLYRFNGEDFEEVSDRFDIPPSYLRVHTVNDSITAICAMNKHQVFVIVHDEVDTVFKAKLAKPLGDKHLLVEFEQNRLTLMNLDQYAALKTIDLPLDSMPTAPEWGIYQESKLLRCGEQWYDNGYSYLVTNPLESAVKWDTIRWRENNIHTAYNEYPELRYGALRHFNRLHEHYHCEGCSIEEAEELAYFSIRDSKVHLIKVLSQEAEYKVYRILGEAGEDTLCTRGDFRLGGAREFRIDHKDAVIASTHHQLYRLRPEITVYNAENPDFISYLHSIHEDAEGNIWFGGYYTGFSVLDKESGTLQKLGEKSSPIMKVLPGGICDARGTQYAIGEEGLAAGNRSKGWRLFPTFSKSGVEKKLAGFNLNILNDTTLLIGSSRNGLLLVKLPIREELEAKQIGADQGLHLTNVLTTAIDDRKRIWMARPSQGMALYDTEKDQLYNYPNQEDDTRTRGIAMKIDSRGTLWIGTTKGLSYLPNVHDFDPEDSDLYTELKPALIHGGSQVGYIEEYQGHLVYGDQVGAHFFNLEAWYTSGQGRPVVHTIETTHAGLGFAEQNTVLVDSEDRLWLGHNDGVMMISDLTEVLHEEDSRPDYDLRISYFGQDDTLMLPTRSFKLPRMQRSFDLSWKRDISESYERLFLEYALVLEGQEDTIISSPVSKSVSIPYINPGKHTLLTRSIFCNQVSEWRRYVIVVPPSLGESPWFWALSASIFFITLFFILYLNRQRILQKKQIQLERAELQSQQDRLRIQAIANSLNPHFINNSLYWLQAKMIRDKEAVQVVQRLSENIQSIFKKSHDGVAFHTLRDELRMVENYLIVQNARFGLQIAFDLSPAELLKKYSDFKLPLLQLQIHIENAVEHGLRHSDLNPSISLIISEGTEALQFLIEDNGIGRPAAKKLGSKGTQQGLKMLHSLHKIYEKYNAHPIRTEYEDNIFTNDDGVGYGTRVHIYIPYNYKYEI